MQLFDQLLQFTLFQGMSRDDLQQVAERTRFDFVKVAPGRPVVSEGDAAQHLCFLLTGQLEVVTTADDRSYAVSEVLHAPLLLQPEALFGYHQYYTRSFSTLTDVSLLRLEKKEVVRLSDEFLVFRINLINTFATQAQRAAHQPWQRCAETLGERIVRFLTQHCLYPAGHKTFHILMTQLANELNDSRLNVSRALNAMASQQLLELQRGRIVVPHLEAMSGIMTEQRR